MCESLQQYYIYIILKWDCKILLKIKQVGNIKLCSRITQITSYFSLSALWSQFTWSWKEWPSKRKTKSLDTTTKLTTTLKVSRNSSSSSALTFTCFGCPSSKCKFSLESTSFPKPFKLKVPSIKSEPLKMAVEKPTLTRSLPLSLTAKTLKKYWWENTKTLVLIQPKWMLSIRPQSMTNRELAS